MVITLNFNTLFVTGGPKNKHTYRGTQKKKIFFFCPLGKQWYILVCLEEVNCFPAWMAFGRAFDEAVLVSGKWTVWWGRGSLSLICLSPGPCIWDLFIFFPGFSFLAASEGSGWVNGGTLECHGPWVRDTGVFSEARSSVARGAGRVDLGERRLQVHISGCQCWSGWTVGTVAASSVWESSSFLIAAHLWWLRAVLGMLGSQGLSFTTSPTPLSVAFYFPFSLLGRSVFCGSRRREWASASS